MTLPILPPDPGAPQASKSKQITGEKLCFTKKVQMGSGWLVSNI